MTKRTPEHGPSITVTRDVDAPPERVFDAWLDREGAGAWLFATPDGEMQRVEIDPRVGGSFRIVEKRGEEIADHFGEYVELDRPRRIVFTFATSFDATPSRVSIEIEAQGAGSRVTLTHELAPEWSDLADSARQGWSMILEGLASSAERTIVITREFDAPRELVWRTWTEAQHVERWWGPRGFTTRVEALDFKVGGATRYVMTGPDGTEYPAIGVFKEIVAPERIVTTDEFDETHDYGMGDLPRGVILTCLFEDLGGRTRLTMRIVHATIEERRTHEEMGVVAGWGSSLDCLDEYLGELS